MKNGKNNPAKGSYIFKVSLDRSIWRTIKLSGIHTLDGLHLAIQTAYDFDNDHIYSFFMDGKTVFQKCLSQIRSYWGTCNRKYCDRKDRFI